MRASVSTKRYWATDGRVWWQDRNHFRLEAYGRARDMRQLPFFGLGSESSLSDETDFTLLERAIGATGWFRPLDGQWIGFGGRAEGLWPSVRSGRSSSVASIEQVFTDGSAPGLSTHPTFTHLQAFLNINYPAGRN